MFLRKLVHGLRDLIVAARRAGLRLEPSKSPLVLNPAAASHVDMLLFPSGIPVMVTHSFELLGAAIGPDSFCQHNTLRKWWRRAAK